MKLTFTHAGVTRTLAKHPKVAAALKAGTMTEADAAKTPWYLRLKVGDKEQKFKLAPTAARDAIRAAIDKLKTINTDEFKEFQKAKAAKESVTVGELADEWLAAGLPFRKTAPRTEKAANELRPKFQRALSWWRDKPVATITAHACEDYAAYRSPHLTGADRELSALSCLFKWAFLSGKIDSNPISKRARFGTCKKHCHQTTFDDDETAHKVFAYMFGGHASDPQHPNACRNIALSGGSLVFSFLTGLRSGEPELLQRVPQLEETPATTKNLLPGTIFPDRSGQLRMKVQRLKGGQNPFVALHPAAASFVSVWQEWLARWMPDAKQLFPQGANDDTQLNRALNITSEALKLPHFTPHAMRAYYVKVRRSQGEDDTTIALELGQTTNGKLIRSTYGDPQDLVGGQLFDWLPEDCAPAWNLLGTWKPVQKPLKHPKKAKPTEAAQPAVEVAPAVSVPYPAKREVVIN
jgi:integrase